MDELHIRNACNTQSDIDFILSANKLIEGDDAALDEARLRTDVFSDTPKASVLILEVDGRPVGLVFYAMNYWASTGSVFWISQMYIEPEHRGKHLYHLKDALQKKAKDAGASVIVWATDKTEQRANDFWEAVGARELNENYSFWFKRVE